MAPLDPRYSQVGFNFSSVQVCDSTYALHKGILSTVSGKKLGWTEGLVVLSSMARGRPRLAREAPCAPALCRGKCRSCIVQVDLQDGPRMITVT